MICLKFTDQAACVEAFAPYLNTDTQGNSSFPAYIGTSAVDVIGLIYKPTGNTTEMDGFVVPETAPLDGWHVNLSGDCPDDLQAFVIPAPGNPVRVFA